MANFTDQISIQWSGGGDSLSESISESAETRVAGDTAMVGSATNGGAVAIAGRAFDYTKLKLIFITSDVNVSLSYATATSPIVITVGPNKPLTWWYVSGGPACPITANTTGLLTATNADATAGTLREQYLVDTSV